MSTSRSTGFFFKRRPKPPKPPKVYKLRKLARRIVLVGAADGGKSTVYEQLVEIYGPNSKQTPDNKEREKKTAIYFLAKHIASYCVNFLRRYSDVEFNVSEIDINLIFDCIRKRGYFSAEDKKVFLKLWSTKECSEYFDEMKTVHSIVKHFIDNIDRFCTEDYELKKEDKLKIYKRTTGVMFNSIQHRDILLEIWQAGGLRQERKKWLSICNDLFGLIMVVSSSEFDQVLLEDPTVNRLEESKDIFSHMVSHKILQNIPIILLFTKTDILEKKLKKYQTEGRNLKEFFPKLKTEVKISKDIVLKYLEEEFRDCIEERDQDRLSVHFVNVLDDADVKDVSNKFFDYIAQYQS